MRFICSLLLSVFLSTGALAADWDAQTRRTNTSVQDTDIQAALSRGLPPQFAQNFPSKNYGIYVLIDRSYVKELNHDVVYISLGLCKRRPDGSYNLPIQCIPDIVRQLSLANIAVYQVVRHEKVNGS